MTKLNVTNVNKQIFNTINTQNLNRKELTKIGLEKIFKLGSFLRKYAQKNKDTNHINRKIFHLLRHPFIFVNAYSNISKNRRALTKGYQDEEMMKFFGLSDAITLAKTITDGTYKFSPAKRTWILKPGKKKKRPIDVPKQSDRIVQETIRGMLEAIYEPVFQKQGLLTKDLSNNYGYRPNFSTWSAVQRIKNNSEACNIVIEGDIVSAFNNVNHDILIKILRERITDEKFLTLIKNLLKSGVMDGGQCEHSFSGTPQGGIVSPILFNIYMLGFDQYIYENFIEPLHRNDDGKRKKGSRTLEYNQISWKFQQKLKEFRTLKKSDPTTNDKAKLKQIYMEFRNLRVTRNSTQYGQVKTVRKRAVYVRYVDDWVLLLTCTLKEAEAIKKNIANFITNEREMELDVEKTKITQYTEGFNFLGFNIRLEKGTKQKLITRKFGKVHTRVMQRTMARVIQISPDAKRILKRLKQQNMMNDKGVATANASWVGSSNYEIVTKYNQIFRGLFNYYKPCGKFAKLSRISYILHYSCARTLARRKKISLAQIFDTFGKQLNVEIKLENQPTMRIKFVGIVHLRANLAKNPEKKYLNIRPSIFDPFRLADHWRTKFKMYVECCLCGERENVSFFRTRITRDTAAKPNKFKSVMKRYNRLQVPICVSCNKLIVQDKYDEIEPGFENKTIAKFLNRPKTL
jgi:group II intron reverse transcriptase/maturase